MFKKYITITCLFFIWSCGTQTSQIDISSLPNNNEEKKEDLSNQSIDDSQGIQFFMDGLMFMEQGDYSRAIIEFQDAIEMGSLSGEIYYSISECYWMIQKYDKSIQYGLLAIDYDDNNRDYSISLGKKYIALNELEKALDMFIAVAEEYEDNADVLFIIGDLKAELNDVDSALVYYQQAYNKDSSLILALEVAAELSLRSNHRYSKTILKKLLLADPSNPKYLQLFIEALPQAPYLGEGLVAPAPPPPTTIG